MNDKVRFVALGGLDEIGKDLYLIEINGDIFVFECGVKFADKTTPGIDFIIADYSYLKSNKHRVKAYFISHGHDDQFGALPYMLKDVPAPVYGSAITKVMLKEFCRVKKLDEKHLDFRIVQPSSKHSIAGHEVLFFQTVHSVPCSFGVAILTSQGYIVYSSDFIIDYNASNSYKSDLNALAKIAEKGTYILMSESIFANRSGYTTPKHRLTPHLEKAVRDLEGRLYVATYYQDVFRMQEIFNFITKNKKKVVFFDSETAQLVKALNSEGELVLASNVVMDYEDLLRIKKEDLVVFLIGNGATLFDKINQLVSGSNSNSHFKLELSDTFIVAAPSASSLERLATDTIDNLYRTEAKIVYFGRSDISGMHASQEDLKMYLSLLKPKFYIPVKGEYRHLLANAQVALSMGIGLSHRSVFIVDNGVGIVFDGDRAEIVPDYAPSGVVLIDGLGVGDVENQVILDRQKLSDDGLIIMAIGVSKKNWRIVTEPDIQMRGFIFVRDGEHVLKRLQGIFISEIENALRNHTDDFHQTRTLIEEICSKRVWRDTGRNPMIVCIVEVVD